MEDLIRLLYFPILLLVVSTFFVLTILIVQKFIIRAREMVNKERIALIEKGEYDFSKELESNLNKYLFWGLVLLGLGIAFILGNFLSNIGDILIIGLIFLFPGLAMLLFYKIQSKKEKEKKEKISTN